MSKSANQKLKLLYLLKILQENTDDDHGITLVQIEEKLGEYGIAAERKTLYSDIEALTLFGIDIVKRRSKTVEYFIANRTFEMPELKLLVDAVQSSKFITHKKSTQLIKKVESLVSKYQAQQLQREVYVTTRTKAMNENIYYNVDKIHNAIIKNRKITFQYFEWALSFATPEKIIKKPKKNGSLYNISPWALTWDDENYYMIGYDGASGKVKHYRVDKMLGIDITDEAREGEEQPREGNSNGKFDLGKYAKMTFGMYGGKEESVKLLMSNSLIGVVADRFGKDIRITQNDKDSFTVTVDVMVSPQFLAWIFGLGEEVKILSPESVVKQFKKHTKRILKRYGKD